MKQGSYFGLIWAVVSFLMGTTGAEPLSWSIQYEGKIVVRSGKDFIVVDLFDVSTADLARIRANRLC